MNWSDGINWEEGHVKVSSVRWLHQPLFIRGSSFALAGLASWVLIGLWSGYTLCCFKGAEILNLEWAADLCLPFYNNYSEAWCLAVNNWQNHLLFWEFGCCSCSLEVTAGRGESHLPLSSFPPPLSALCLQKVWERGSFVLKVQDLLLGLFFTALSSHFPPFPKEKRLKESGGCLGNTLSLSCLCVWVQCFWWGGRHSCLKLNRAIPLWASLKFNYFFFCWESSGRFFKKENLNCICTWMLPKI